MAGAERANLVITGASGQLGRRTAELVIEQGGTDGLILVTRDPAALADLAAQGVDVRPGDFDHPDLLRQACMAGAEGLLRQAEDD